MRLSREPRTIALAKNTTTSVKRWLYKKKTGKAINASIAQAFHTPHCKELFVVVKTEKLKNGNL